MSKTPVSKTKKAPATSKASKTKEEKIISEKTKAKSKDETKVLKVDELGGTDDFLSGLGFSAEQQEETPAPAKKKKGASKTIVKEEIEVVTPMPQDETVVVPSNDDQSMDAATYFKQFQKKAPAFQRDKVAPKPEFQRTQPRQAQFGPNGTGPTPPTPRPNVSFQRGTPPRPRSSQPPQPRSSQPTPSLPKREKEVKVSHTLIKKDDISMGDKISVKEFSEKMGVPLMELIKKLLENKIMMGINGVLDFDTASLIAEEFGVKVKKHQENLTVEDLLSGNLQALLAQDKTAEHVQKRPPIVTVMGHVDHGKTKLLDYIRKTNIISGEAGGITQSIGASQILHDGQKITFIDTPGHELFTSLRARGSKVTDIVIIVVAADEGMKQQTVEAINHAKESGVPIIVAATKIDKPNSNFEMLKTQMAENGLIPEERGGTVPLIGVSAVSGAGINELLDLILLQSELLELVTNPKRPAVGIVLDAYKDAKQGVVASIIVMSGRLQISNIVVVHDTYGKIKKMIDWQGKPVQTAFGGDPVVISGLKDVPEPGRILEGVATEKIAQERIEQIQNINQQEVGHGIQSFLNRLTQGDQVQLKLILKADGWGSLEALKQAVSSIEMPENVQLKIIHADIGNFSDSDVALAQASNAFMLGFNVPIHSLIKKKAESLQLTIKSYDVIYELIDYVKALAQGMIKIDLKEVVIGKLKVLRVFFRKVPDVIFGGKVIEGEVRNGASFRLWRDEELIGQGKISSLQREQDNVDKVSEGHECGMKAKFSKKMLEEDILEFFVME